MNTRPTFASLEPVREFPFTYGASYQPRRATGLPESFNAPQQVNPQAVAAIHRAFTLAKTGHNGWKSYKREGRFDPRRAAGATRLEQDVFKRKTGRSTTKVRVAVLIDASGSMSDQDTARVPNPLDPTSRKRYGTRARLAAAVFGATVATALAKIPTVSLDVFEHSAGLASDLYIKWRWHKGTPIAVFNETASQMQAGGGNADGHAIFAIASRMLKELKHDEKGIIMLVSDGMPSVYPSGTPGLRLPSRLSRPQAGQALIDGVAFARKNGIEVIAVAVDGSDQSVYYGKDNVLPFTGDWALMGKGLAKHVGAALAAR